MVSKASLVIVCLAIVQGINSAIVNTGPNSCYLQIQQVSSQIGLAANAARLEVSSAVLNNKNNIVLARQSITLQIQSLWNTANTASGPNAQICKTGLNIDLAQLNSQALNLCYLNAEKNLLNLQVNQISNLKGVANQLCSSCARQFPLPSQMEDRENCVSAGIENIQSQLGNLQAQISSGASDIQAKSGQCVQEAESNATHVIGNAKTNLDVCIQST